MLEVDPLQREILLNEAMEAGDETTVAAFLGAPAIFKMLAGEKLAEARHRWAERRNPAKAQEAARLERAVDAAQRMIRSARSRVQEAAGLAEDPIAAMAAGERSGAE